MKKKILKAVSLVVATTLLLGSMAGCAKGKQTSETPKDTGKGQEGTQQGDDQQAEGEKKWDKKLKVTIAGYVGPINSEFGVLTDPVTKLLNEKFNIEIDMIDAGDSSDWVTRLNALIASDELPDIICPTAQDKQIPMMVAAGQILELTPYITEKTTPNVYKDQVLLEMQKKTNNAWGLGEKLYCFDLCKGTWDNGAGATVGDFIRWDLYKELGYPKLENYDDLLDVLKQMQDKYPTNADGEKAYAIGAWFGDGMGWGDWPIIYARNYVGPTFGASVEGILAIDKKTMSVVEGNQLKNKDSAYWQMINFYYKANQLGILDPESFTQKYDAYQEKCNQGRYYYINPGWEPAGYQVEYNKTNPDMGFAMVPALNGDCQTLNMYNPRGERTAVISSKTEDPERMVALLDYISSYEFSTIAYNGVEGVYWTNENGIPTPKPELYDKSIEDETRKTEAGMGIYGHLVGYASGTINPDTNTPVGLFNTPVAMESNLTNVQKDQMKYYGASSLQEAFSSKIANTTYYDAYRSSLNISDELQLDYANLQDYKFKNSFKIILAKDDAEFNQLQEQFMKDLDQYRVDEIYEDVYKKAKADEKLVQDLVSTYK